LLAIVAGTTLTIAKTKAGTGAALPRMLVHVSVK
jgi:hypothetical protein